MPFAGDRVAARAAAGALRSLATVPGDELILADNAGAVAAAPDVTVRATDERSPAPDVTVVPATAESSPAHARNVGARGATREWILFLDSDCRPSAGLLDAYFAEPVADDVGALAGEVRAAAGAQTVVGRYGAHRNFLSQQAHLAHPFRPRAVAANLLVRRCAFEQLGGFYEGLRAAEDTDFSWRLQEAGWRLELRSGAWVEHHYRADLGELRRQWRGYAAGRAWLARRYGGFTPDPALRRALRRGLARLSARAALASPRAVAGEARVDRQARAAVPPGSGPGGLTRADRARFLALDALLSVEELAGLTLSNCPRRHGRARHRAGDSVQAVLVAERFPGAGDPLVELARTLGRVRVEAAGRPRQIDHKAFIDLEIAYREDDGVAARALARAALVVRHPFRCLRDRARRPAGQPALAAIAPTVTRLERDPGASVVAFGSEPSRSLARRMARLAGRPCTEAPDRVAEAASGVRIVPSHGAAADPPAASPQSGV
jgi:GT2 family glycosyltransferase